MTVQPFDRQSMRLMLTARYVGPTDTKGARIKVSFDKALTQPKDKAYKRSLTVAWDYNSDTVSEQYATACADLLALTNGLNKHRAIANGEQRYNRLIPDPFMVSLAPYGYGMTYRWESVEVQS